MCSHVVEATNCEVVILFVTYLHRDTKFKMLSLLLNIVLATLAAQVYFYLAIAHLLSLTS